VNIAKSFCLITIFIDYTINDFLNKIEEQVSIRTHLMLHLLQIPWKIWSKEPDGPLGGRRPKGKPSRGHWRDCCPIITISL